MFAILLTQNSVHVLLMNYLFSSHELVIQLTSMSIINTKESSALIFSERQYLCM